MVRRVDFEFNRNPLGLHLGSSGDNTIRFILFKTSGWLQR